jgi:hypothetical protein
LVTVIEERVLFHPMGYDGKGTLEERVGLIVWIARSFEQFTPGPVTETVEEQLRPLHDGGIGPYLRSHGTTLWCSRREGASDPPDQAVYHVRSINARIWCALLYRP